MNQEILVGPHVYLALLKEKLQEWIEATRALIQKDYRKRPDRFQFTRGYFVDTLSKLSDTISKKMRYFLATGNVVSQSGLDLMQVSGYTILADKLNYHRYLHTDTRALITLTKCTPHFGKHTNSKENLHTHTYTHTHILFPLSSPSPSQVPQSLLLRSSRVLLRHDEDDGGEKASA